MDSSEFHPSIVCRKLPANTSNFIISRFFPCAYLALNFLNVTDPLIQALGVEDAQLALSNIKLASMFKRINKLKSVPECLCYFWEKSFVE